MKNVKIIFICLLTMLIAACTNKDAYKLTVSAPDFAEGKAYIVYVADSLIYMDSTNINADGVALFKGERAMPLYCQLLCRGNKIEDKYIPLILEPGEIEVNASVDSVTGTEKNLLLQGLMTQMNQYQINEEALIKQYYEAAEANDEALCALIDERYDKAQSQKINVIKEFITANNENAVGAAALYMNFKEFTYTIDAEDLIGMVENAGEEFLSQPQLKTIIDYTTRLKKVLPGQLFTDVEMLNLKGETVRLANFVGNKDYLVIDFWASWCGPCRRSMPALKGLYSTYGKYIDIVGISLDNDEEKWKNAVESLQLPWNQISDLKGWQCEGARIYCVNAIPHLVLIDKNGTIVARALFDESLKAKLEELIPQP